MRTTAALLLAVAVAATGCSGEDSGGGSDGAPSVTEFCTALAAFDDAVDDVDPATDLPGYIRALQGAATVLDEGGVPGEMPADAQDGFVITIQRIQALSESATLDELSQLGDVPDDDQARLDALDDYITSACPDLGDEASP